MSFTDKSKNWTESEESFYSAYETELDYAFRDYFDNLISDSGPSERNYLLAVKYETVYWEFVDEQYSKFEDMVQAQLARREYPDYSKFVVTL